MYTRNMGGWHIVNYSIHVMGGWHNSVNYLLQA